MRSRLLTGGRSTRWLLVAAVVLVAAMGGLLTACGGQGATTTSAAATAIAVTTTTPSTPSTTVPVAQTESLMQAFEAAWDNAWTANDPALISSFYADDFTAYDDNLNGMALAKKDIDGMLFDPDWWKAFQARSTTYFVSWDGRFAANLGMFAARDESGNLPWQPGANLLAFANNKVVWEYDYYGGVMGASKHTEPLPVIPPGTVEPGSPPAQAAIAATTAALDNWLAAYNSRDTAAYLSAYDEKASYVDVVSPDWRVMTKSELAADVAAHFARNEFQTKLKPSPGSPIGSFFVSADGRFAAAQGSYADVGTPGQPMLVILELQGGKIVQQYNFIALDRGALQP